MVLVTESIYEVTAHNLYHAFENGDLNKIKSLVSQFNIDPLTLTKPSPTGFSPCQIACINSHYNVVNILFETIYRNSQCATDEYDLHIKKQILSSCLEIQVPLNKDIIGLLIENTLKLNLYENFKSGSTILHSACQYGHAVIFDYIMSADFPIEGEAAQHPIANAIKSGFIYGVDRLAFTCNIDKYGTYFIELAELHGQFEVASLLSLAKNGI